MITTEKFKEDIPFPQGGFEFGVNSLSYNGCII